MRARSATTPSDVNVLAVPTDVVAPRRFNKDAVHSCSASA